MVVLAFKLILANHGRVVLAVRVILADHEHFRGVLDMQKLVLAGQASSS